ncbi:transcriptional regulator [Aliidiomarina shirensis]|uniref:Transcriptional regulator n=1 Tax=Aliidiomarina shirensis TaxID=1048642 RepID=A0A432WXF8_9GAMM|nr:P-II family nitrogen regulator [Aliidiomarina shirensis]RUO38453.1 transcriptional regulator [Aliidiomarina shirensis]
MQLITAIIKPAKLSDVRDALTELGCKGMTVTEVRGFGRQKGHSAMYRGAEYQTEFLPKIRIDIAADDDHAHAIVEAIQISGHTGNTGDGKIFVMPLAQVIRIRTGETGSSAI